MSAPSPQDNTKVGCQKLQIYQVERGHHSFLPHVPEKPASFVPVYYTFRAESRKKLDIDRSRSRPPPFYIQFDNAIGVIWTIFNEDADKSKLGINQLQWTEVLLRNLRQEDGLFSPDIDLCIQVVDDFLVDHYAHINSRMDELKRLELQANSKTKEPFSPNYAEMMAQCPSTPFNLPLDCPELEDILKIDTTVDVAVNKLRHLKNDKMREADFIEEVINQLSVLDSNVSK